MNKKLGNIIIVYGTPNAGKSTICNKFIKKSQTVFAKNMWKLESFDNEIEVSKKKRNGKSPKEIILKIINNNIELLNIYNEIKKAIPQKNWEQILKYIWKTSIKKNIPKFIPSQKIMNKLEKLNIKVTASIKDIKQDEYIYIQKIMRKAIMRSNKGLCTILDLVSLYHTNFNPPKEVNKILRERNFKGSCHFALIHVSLPDLMLRMDGRNKKAKETGNLSNQRNYDNILHYPFTFGQTPLKKSQKHISILTKRDYKLVLKKLEKKKNTQKLLKESYNFSKGVDSIKIYPKLYFNSIYNSTSWISTLHIVNKLIGIAGNMQL